MKLSSNKKQGVLLYEKYYNNHKPNKKENIDLQQKNKLENIH